MNIVQLEYFLSVAETGSFRKTSEMMYVSQPAVSKQISLLAEAILTKLGNVSLSGALE